MRIVIAAVSSNRSLSGVSRHAANLAKCLLLRPEIAAVHVLVAPWEREFLSGAISREDKRLRIHTVPLQRGTLQRNAWYYRTLPLIAGQLRADIVHLAYPCPISAGAFQCPVVVTLHDLYACDIPSNFGYPKVLLNRIVLRQCLSEASALACVSEATRERLRAIMPHHMAKATTICNYAETSLRVRKPSFASGRLNCRFLLCVAQHRRNKNVLLALRVFRRVLNSGEVRPDTRLVVVGLPGPESGRLHRFVKEARLTESVIFVDGIPDAELGWCYRNCELLLAPSSIEGFGLPILEAQLVGCRIVCSDIPAFREVGSPDCRFVPITADAEGRFAQEVIMALHLRRPSPAYFPQFCPSVIAGQYVDLYGRLLHGSELAVPPAFSLRRPESHPESVGLPDLLSASKPRSAIVKQL